jgi:hypothetical protein
VISPRYACKSANVSADRRNASPIDSSEAGRASSRAMARLHALVLIGALTGCGTSSPVLVVAPAPEPSAPSEPALDTFAGRFRIWGETIEDGCDRRIVLAARHLAIDPAARTVFADVVERTYEARVEGGQLIAEGRFDVESACPNTTIFERWTLAWNGDGLEGQLESTWQLAPECRSVCTLRLAIHAERIPADPEPLAGEET